MPLSIDLPNDLETKVNSLAAAEGGDVSEFVLAAIAEVVERKTQTEDMLSRAPTSMQEEVGGKALSQLGPPRPGSMRERLAGTIGKYHGGGTAWSQIEAPCDPH